MDQQLNERLSTIEKKLDDMNAVVARMHRSQQNARNRRLLYWGVIIVLTIISYYSIKPYLEQVKEAYGFIDTSSSDYTELLKTLNQ